MLFIFSKNSVTLFSFINSHGQRVIFCSQFIDGFAYSSIWILENVTFMRAQEAFFSEFLHGTFRKNFIVSLALLAKFVKSFKSPPL